MVWFQCEDCGENLKKPKLPNHFRICSANKLSCIDCGETFSQQSVQGHTQCISEAEKYGPKGQAKALNGTPAKAKDTSKPNSDVDINVGLSSRPPWACSLCNTKTTSQQTLLLHAEGKKHRAKARAFHAANKQSNQAVESTVNKEVVPNGNEEVRKDGQKDTEEPGEADQLEATVAPNVELEKECVSEKKRKLDASGSDKCNGEVIQAERAEKESGTSPKKKKSINSCCEDQTNKKIKWKKLITSILKSDANNALKLRKLQKFVLKSLQESGITQDESEVKKAVIHKIESSSRFTLDNKLVRLAPRGRS